MYVCPADGHLMDPHFATGPHCPRHGVPFFTHCPECGAPWPLVARGGYVMRHNAGADFCASCATPAPWLSRRQLMEWVRNQLRASGEVSRAEALELEQLLGRLVQMDANDTKTVEAWKRIRDAAPQVWEATKPVRDALIGEAVKKALGL